VQSNFLDDLRLSRDSLGRINFERERGTNTESGRENSEEGRRRNGRDGIDRERYGKEKVREG